MVLLTHAGRERAVDADELQHLGNPLLLRRPLDLGVKVVAFDCAADGEDIDLDDPDRSGVSSFDLFLRLMDEPRYEGLLCGEVYGYNPLLFDFVVKRTMRHPRTGTRFASTVFGVPGPLRHAFDRAGGHAR